MVLDHIVRLQLPSQKVLLVGFTGIHTFLRGVWSPMGVTVFSSLTVCFLRFVLVFSRAFQAVMAF